MLMRILPDEKRKEALRILLAHGTVVAPVARDGRFVFAPVRRGEEVRLDAPQTIHSAKAAYFPPQDPYLRFTLDAGTWEKIPPDGPIYLLGVHPCDLHALAAFEAWMKEGIPEERFLARRAQMSVAAVRCMTRCNADSFCDAMETYRPAGEDLLLTRLDGAWALETRGHAGEKWIAKWEGLLRAPDAAEAEFLRGAEAKAEAAFSGRSIDRAALPGALGAARGTPAWAEMAERCLDCGQCVAVCPTCTCFASVEECDATLTCAVRTRVWDGCLYAPFAEVAGGHNFRRERKARLRHRMNRKGNWLPSRFGIPFCVGCGRCVSNCPVGISPLSVFRRTLGEDVRV